MQLYYVNKTQSESYLADDCKSVKETVVLLRYTQPHSCFKVHSYMRNDEKPREKLTLCTYVAQNVFQIATYICGEYGRRAWCTWLITVIIDDYRVQYLFY